MNKITIEYDPIKGDVMPDGKVHKYIDDTTAMAKNAEHIKLVIGSVLLFDAFRVAVKEGRIDHRNITIHFDKRSYNLDTNGKMAFWPIGLCDVYDDILDRLM